ncbi:uncharacterized protein LOC131942557 [Physella acuta]|uniref:uncharacterized protein LOC131942557 n=1 Tax=Physella acuta TaxID=109671 RepID=UPI0027DE46CA|nr:uncharacterized protein LOC131942557 [Physella acuta]
MFSILSTQKALSAIYCNTGTQLLSLYALRMEDATFLQCIGTPIVYAHAKVCPSCDGANTLSSCDQNVMCEEESSFCESRYSFDLLGGSISFNCTNKDTCLSQEKKNRMSCTTEGTETTECYFCCFGESCEPKNEGD